MPLVEPRPASGAVSAIYRRIRAWDRQTQMVMDLLVLVLAFWFSYLLRFDFRLPEVATRSFLAQLPVVLLVQVLAAYSTGVYSFIWRFVGLAELRAFIVAALVSPLPLLALRFGLPEELRYGRPPLSIILMDTVLAFGGLLLLRVLRRSLHERSTARTRSSKGSPDERVLIIGAGHTGVTIAKEIRSRGDSGLNAIGILDDDPAKIGSVISGVRVLGSLDRLASEVRNRSIDQVILAISALPSERMRRLVELCDSIPVALRVVPPLAQILDGSVAISRLRPVEIEDLLGRDPVTLDTEQLDRFLAGKRVLITGAGGSIGSEIARQVLRFEPSSLVLVERAEYPLFQLIRELESTLSTRMMRRVRPLVADAGDEHRMRSVLGTHRPEVIVHAAAHKHVGLMENNACEAVRNNVGATAVLSRLAGEFEAETFVLVSTDKAVRPTSVMGATKRIAERIVLEHDRTFPATRYVAVRFGNVLGSTGSVIPIFRDQIASGGPVTVTHPKMVRYFMTIPEASQLVLQAGSFGAGGEILILDMGEPVSIIRLAEDMIRLSGLTPHEDIDIVFTGSRPGEKIVEELTVDPAELLQTAHPKIFASAGSDEAEGLGAAISELSQLASLGLESDVRGKLGEIVPEARLGRLAPALPSFAQTLPPDGDLAEREPSGTFDRPSTAPN